MFTTNIFRFISNTVVVLALTLGLFTAAAFSQTTDFSYQGSLKDGANNANGSYDFEFRVFDAATGGTQVGSLVTRTNVAVATGIFSVKLDFGNSFSGADRYLEIRVRNAGGTGYTLLDPRQRIGSEPYAIKSLTAETANSANTATSATSATFATTAGSATNSSQLGGVAANQFVQTGDSRLTDARSPTAGSANYIQNTTAAQATSNFNVSGDGTVGGTMRANVLRTATTVNINAIPVLSIAGVGNVFTGAAAGNSNTGTFNAFYGNQAGSSNTAGSNNSFFGGLSGNANTMGSDNAFFGRNAGNANTTGSDNAFFGRNAGAANNADQNAFFGSSAGAANTSGFQNAFFGFESGRLNSQGAGNSFFGYQSGRGNFLGRENSFFGWSAGLTTGIGSGNSFYGSASGYDNTDGSGNSFYGDQSGPNNTIGNNNTFFGYQAGGVNTTGGHNTVIGSDADVGSNNLTYATAIGAESVVSANNTIALGRSNGSDRVRIYGRLAVNTLAAATATNVCINTLTSELASCSSSIRYKTNIAAFNVGLGFVNRLRPVTFDWKESNENDLGLIAEEVEAINPLLVTYNKNGEIQGVKYDRIGVVLINAIKEQQVQIDKLTKLVCAMNKDADICKEK